MTLTITPDTKNSLSVTNDTPAEAGRTWASTETWDEAAYTWDEPRTLFTKDTKNGLSISNESKS